jgi:glycosyltransferase involved in cell wall biosynthesis
MEITSKLNHSYSTNRRLGKEEPIFSTQMTNDKLQVSLFLSPNLMRKAEGGLRKHGYFKYSTHEYLDNKPLNVIPLVTIITVVFNGEKHIEQTIKSVLSQTYDNVEYIIIDGGSTDRTVDIIAQYDTAIDYWVSELDQGLYFAMNKGISLATGDIIGILNVGDFYECDAIQNSINYFVNNQADYTYGKVVLVNEDGDKCGTFSPIPKHKIGQAIYYVQPYPHISAFFRRNVYLQEGGFDTNYKVSADHEFSLRVHTKKYRGIDSGVVIGFVRPAGLSGSANSTKESMEIAIKYGKNKIYVYALYRFYVMNRYLASILPNFIVLLIKKIKGSRFQSVS